MNKKITILTSLVLFFASYNHLYGMSLGGHRGRTASMEHLMRTSTADQREEGDGTEYVYHQGNQNDSEEEETLISKGATIAKKGCAIIAPLAVTTASATILGPHSGPAAVGSALTAFTIYHTTNMKQRNSCEATMRIFIPTLIAAAFGALCDYYLTRQIDPYMPRNIALYSNLGQTFMWLALIQFVNWFQVTHKTKPNHSLTPMRWSDGFGYELPHNKHTFDNYVYLALNEQLSRMLERTYDSTRDINAGPRFIELFNVACKKTSKAEVVAEILRMVEDIPLEQLQTAQGSRTPIRPVPQLPLSPERRSSSGASIVSGRSTQKSTHQREVNQQVGHLVAAALLKAISSPATPRAPITADNEAGAAGGQSATQSPSRKPTATHGTGTEDESTALSRQDLAAFGVTPQTSRPDLLAPVPQTNLLKPIGKRAALTHNPSQAGQAGISDRSIDGQATSAATLSNLPLRISSSDSSGGSLPKNRDEAASTFSLPGTAATPSPQPERRTSP